MSCVLCRALHKYQTQPCRPPWGGRSGRGRWTQEGCWLWMPLHKVTGATPCFLPAGGPDATPTWDGKEHCSSPAVSLGVQFFEPGGWMARIRGLCTVSRFWNNTSYFRTLRSPLLGTESAHTERTSLQSTPIVPPRLLGPNSTVHSSL